MKRQLIQTADVSHSFAINDGRETYHSRHGAVQESLHVFIEAGLRAIQPEGCTRVLELGFGTGLNALLTWREAEGQGREVAYTSIEPFPLALDEAELLNYARPEEREAFMRMHTQPNGESVISAVFSLDRRMANYPAHPSEKNHFHAMYYDAFGPATQPELWTPECFAKAFEALVVGGVLVTYCAKGQVRRDLKAAGFEVERLAGPPGKREMLRAWKRQ